MMQKIEKLLDLAIAYLERELNQVQPRVYTEVKAEAPKKTRKRTAKKAAAPAPTPDVDPLLGVPAAAPAAAPAPAMSDKEVIDKSNELALAYVRRFANTADGVAAVQKIVRDRYKAARLQDLDVNGRRDFIGHVEAVIKEADTGA